MSQVGDKVGNVKAAVVGSVGNVKAAVVGAVGNTQAALAGAIGNAQAEGEATAAAVKEKLEKAKAAAEKLKALKDRLKKKKQSPPKLPPVPEYTPKPLPKEEIVKFKNSPPPPDGPLDRNGYTYVVKTSGPNYWIVVYNNTELIFEGRKSFTTTIDVLLETAILNLEDQNDGSRLLYPNIRNLIRKVDK
jgi:hypothetical protein